MTCLMMIPSFKLIQLVILLQVDQMAILELLAEKLLLILMVAMLHTEEELLAVKTVLK